MRIELNSLFRALSLHCFLPYGLIWWFTLLTPFPFTIITSCVWYWVPLSLFIYTFWALITTVSKPMNTVPTAAPLISCWITYFVYEQLRDNQENTHSKRTLSLSHKLHMLALRHQARSRGYAGRQSVRLVCMVFALTQIYWLKSNVCWGYVGVSTHCHLSMCGTSPGTFIRSWSNECLRLFSRVIIYGFTMLCRKRCDSPNSTTKLICFGNIYFVVFKERIK